MFNIWKLITIAHRRKKYILWLIIVIFAIVLLIPLFNSIALWQGDIINTSFQHIVIEVVGLLFIVYFGSTLLKQFTDNKTLQLLWSKKKQPLRFIIECWLGLYSIYAVFVLVAMIISFLYYGDSILIMTYINLLISGAIALSVILLFSCLTNSYAAMLSTIIIYLISYSINFIIFSTPIAFEKNISYTILTVVQYLFPRFDILYSSVHTPITRWWTVFANFLYFICISFIMIRVFLSRFAQK